jgi:hypothetical protein
VAAPVTRPVAMVIQLAAGATVAASVAALALVATVVAALALAATVVAALALAATVVAVVATELPATYPLSRARAITRRWIWLVPA